MKGAASQAVLELPAPSEPLDLRQQLREALLGGAEWEAQFGAELGVGDVLWSAWGESLSRAGMTRTQFAAVLGGYRRELWYWVVGDRIWTQAVTGLAGRLLRRVPAV